MDELWLPIIGFENYQVSNHGRVRGISGNLIARIINDRGYERVRLRKNGKWHSKPVHRLVAETHMNIEPNHPVNHVDGNKANNHVSNLERTTTRENTTHYYGRMTGASKNSGCNTWKSQIRINGVNLYLGSFPTQIDAHNAYLEAMKEHGIENKYAQKGGE